MRELVFLGGTCGNNQWRDSFIEQAVARGIDKDAFFNPVVADWTAEAQAREEDAKATATVMLFYIADPKQEGNPISAYSLLEATMALYDLPGHAVVVFDTEGMSGHPLKAMNQACKVLKKRFLAPIFGSRGEALNWLVDTLVTKDPDKRRPLEMRETLRLFESRVK